MDERTVGIAEAKARLSELVAAAQKGEDVVITKRGKPVATLSARERPKRRVDLAWLRAQTQDMPFQEEDSGTFMRRFRDDDRY